MNIIRSGHTFFIGHYNFRIVKFKKIVLRDSEICNFFLKNIAIYEWAGMGKLVWYSKVRKHS